MKGIHPAILAALIGLLLLPAVGLAQDLINPTAQTRTVAGSAFASDDTDSMNESNSDEATDFSPFMGAESANATVPTAQGSGGGTQDSAILANGLTASGSAFATGESFDTGGFADGSGSSKFSVDFTVTARASFTLQGMVAAFDSGSVDLSLTGAGGEILGFSASGKEVPFSETVVLPEGDYTLSACASGSALGEFFSSEFAFAEYDVSFLGAAIPAPVPSMGTWGLLLLGALVFGVGAVRAGRAFS